MGWCGMEWNVMDGLSKGTEFGVWGGVLPGGVLSKSV